MRSSNALLTIVLIACSLMACQGFRGLTFRTPGDSMSPTIKAGDSVFADPVYYKHSPVHRGEIVVVIDPDGKKNPSGQAEMYVKRVIGMGGDRVQVKAEKVYVNDQLLDGILGSGKYESTYPISDFGPIVVPQNEYFLLGDNLSNSYDSRHWTHSTIRLEGIYGKVTAVKDGKTGTIRYL